MWTGAIALLFEALTGYSGILATVEPIVRENPEKFIKFLEDA